MIIMDVKVMEITILRIMTFLANDDDFYIFHFSIRDVGGRHSGPRYHIVIT